MSDNYEPRHVRAKRGREIMDARIRELERENAQLRQSLAAVSWAEVKIDYTNWKDERRVYRIRPTGRIVRDNVFHPDIPFAIEALDLDRNVIRTFDPWRIHRWGDYLVGLH